MQLAEVKLAVKIYTLIIAMRCYAANSGSKLTEKSGAERLELIKFQCPDTIENSLDVSPSLSERHHFRRFAGQRMAETHNDVGSAAD